MPNVTRTNVTKTVESDNGVVRVMRVRDADTGRTIGFDVVPLAPPPGPTSSLAERVAAIEAKLGIVPQ